MPILLHPSDVQRKISAVIFHVCYRPSTGTCGCMMYYDGQEDLLFNLNNKTFVHYGLLLSCLHLMVEGRNPLAAFHSLPVPEGLMNLLETYPHKIGEGFDTLEKASDLRAKLYRRIACLIIYGNGLKGKTIIFPDHLQTVVRAKYPCKKKPYDDPDHPNVHRVTYGELSAMKWPKKK
ncbi:uncharacterized protein [Ptychodera flava]|uniref:uncharacterized protein n=1 Tax=Ptychodera flava TaxID=63121 RepID=UPI003969F300